MKHGSDSSRDIVIKFGRTISIIREYKDLSMRDLAKKAKVSVSTVSLIESAQRSPTLDTMVSIANALDLKLEAIFALADELGDDMILFEQTKKDIAVQKNHLADLYVSVAKKAQKLLKEV